MVIQVRVLGSVSPQAKRVKRMNQGREGILARAEQDHMHDDSILCRLQGEVYKCEMWPAYSPIVERITEGDFRYRSDL